VTDTTADLDVLYLPLDMKREFCLDLLETVGAQKISVRDNRNEITHCCVAPWHQHTKWTPSASLNFDKMTYRCLGCPAKGGILWLIGITQGVYGPEAREWLAGQTGLGGKEFQLAPLLQFLDAIEEATRKGHLPPPPMPVYSDVVLEPWCQAIYPGLTTGVPELGIEGRGIPEPNLVEARVGWAMDEDRIVIPHFWKGDLVGWQSRRILDDGSPKYNSTPDFPRDRTLYLPQREKPSKRIVVVESPMSVLRHLHHQPMGGTFGFAITDAQIALLKWYPEIIWCPDPDAAGWAQVEGHWDEKGRHQPGPVEALTAFSNVRVLTSDWVDDSGALDEDTFSDLVDSAVPFSIWERPTALRCMRCREVHTGYCQEVAA
jgi:hypothetical protein